MPIGISKAFAFASSVARTMRLFATGSPGRPARPDGDLGPARKPPRCLGGPPREPFAQSPAI
eukprot:2446201-Pyramimonas_sp.AAC.1